MPDDPNTPDPNAGQAGGTPPAGTPPPGQQGGQPPAGSPPAPRTFTQEEVNQLTGRAREEGRQAALKKAGGEGSSSSKPEGQNGSGVTAPQVPNVEELIQRSISQALQAAGVDPFTQQARAAGYSDAQIKLARAAADVEKPPDLGKWLTEWPASIGMQLNPGGAQSSAAPQGGPQVGAPRTVKRLEQESGLVDVFSLSDAEVTAMPIEQLVAHFEKAKDAARQSQGAPLLPRALRKK